MSAELLPERMREAAKVIEDACAEYHRRCPDGSWLARTWAPHDLLSWADLWEREDCEAQKQKDRIDELANMISGRLFALGVNGYNVAARGIATQVIEAGWRNDG